MDNFNQKFTKAVEVTGKIIVEHEKGLEALRSIERVLKIAAKTLNGELAEEGEIQKALYGITTIKAELETIANSAMKEAELLPQIVKILTGTDQQVNYSLENKKTDDLAGYV